MGSELVRMYTFSQTNTVCPGIHIVLEQRTHNGAAAPSLFIGMGFQSFILSQCGQDL